MKFNDTTDKQGILQHCETLLGMEDAHISGDSTLLKIFTRLCNVWYRRADNWIWEADSAWQFDDSNYTNLPRATTDLVDDQHDYEIPSSARQIFEVHIKDSSGNWVMLQAIDKDEYNMPLDEYYDEKGVPSKYDAEGQSIFLYPAPDSSETTLSSGLRILMGRDIDEFASDDTDTEPGFDNHFHPIIPVGASLDYAMGYYGGDSQRIGGLKNQLQELRQELATYYGDRHKDYKTKLRRKINRQNFV